MQKADCFQLGFISRLHGVKGELVAVFDTDQPQRYKNLESVFVDIRGELVPFFIEEIAQNSKGHFIVRLEDVDSEEAQTLVDRELFLPLELLPPLSGKSFYYHEVVGFAMEDLENGALGHCTKILENGAQPVFFIEGLKGEEILVPAVDAFIEKIDREQRQIILSLPPGLLDLYQ